MTEANTVSVNHSMLRFVRLLGLLEGISTLILFGIAMPLKYLADLPIAVRIAGSVHGLLFTGLVVLLMISVRRVPIPRRLAWFGIVAAVFPGGPFLIDRRLREIGR